MALAQLLPSRVRNYRTTIITNANVRSGEEVERKIDAGDVTEVDRPLGVAYPAGLYSLSHVALPFPMSDSLYGLTPDPSEDFGIHLGSIAPRGEGNVLIASLDSLLRASSNPFFPYMIERIDDGIEGRNLATKTTSIPSSTSSGDKMDSDTSGLSIHDIMTFISSLAHGQADTTVDAP